MQIPFLDLKPQYRQIEAELKPILEDIMSNGAFIGGPQVAAFEEEFAAFCGGGHCVGLNSGTDALRFALMASGVGPGDEVITVPNTFIATTEAICSATGADIRWVEPTRAPTTWTSADRAPHHAAHARHSAGAPVWPAGRHGRDPGHRPPARLESDRRLRPGPWRPLPRPARGRAGRHRLLQLLPRQKPGRLRRRRRDRDQRPGPGRAGGAAARARPAAASTPTLSRAPAGGWTICRRPCSTSSCRTWMTGTPPAGRRPPPMTRCWPMCRV